MMRQSPTSWRSISMLLVSKLRRSNSIANKSSSFAACARCLKLGRTEASVSNRSITTLLSRGSEFSQQMRRNPWPQQQQHADRSVLCRALLHHSDNSWANVDDAKPIVDVKVLDHGRIIVVRFCDEQIGTPGRDVSRSMRFNATWLRHNCQCELCVHKSTRNKLTRPAKLATLYHVESADVVVSDVDAADDCSVVRIQWREDAGSHVSQYPINYLLSSEPRSAAHRLAENTPTNVISTGSPLPSIDYEELLSDIRGGGQRILLQWLHLINEHGACLLRGVPVIPGQVNRVAEMICPVQPTVYGDTWHVRSDPKPITIAYSDVELDFHMDLPYYESPPGILFIHYLRIDACVEGGESLFVDAWHVAETMRTQHPEEFRTLTQIPATFQQIHFDRERPVYMTYRRPHIVVEPHTESIIGVNWAPPFEGPLDHLDDINVDRYYQAYSLFARLLDKSSTRVEMRMEQGDLVCLNNRRMLHARHAFKLNGGSRHLNGCYINIDEFKSRMRVLVSSQTQNVDTVPPIRHVFNHSWS